jgi:hypothetical protein
VGYLIFKRGATEIQALQYISYEPTETYLGAHIRVNKLSTWYGQVTRLSSHHREVQRIMSEPIETPMNMGGMTMPLGK